MSDPFMFTDAPQQPREAPTKKEKPIEPVAAKPIVSTSRRGPDHEPNPIPDDLDVVMNMVGLIKGRSPRSRDRLLNAVRMILET